MLINGLILGSGDIISYVDVDNEVKITKLDTVTDNSILINGNWITKQNLEIRSLITISNELYILGAEKVITSVSCYNGNVVIKVKGNKNPSFIDSKALVNDTIIIDEYAVCCECDEKYFGYSPFSYCNKCLEEGW